MADLPHTRNVNLLVSEVHVLSPCCSCREKEGVLVCSGCQAVTYCGEECQEKSMNDHKQICNEINQHLQQGKAGIEALANEYGGDEALLEASLVKERRFRFRDKYLFLLSVTEPDNYCQYYTARRKLIDSYVKCGEISSSKLAFRLAAENLLQILQLCRKGYLYMPEFSWFKYCGWMVAGDMDQQALNFLSCIQSNDDLYLDLENFTLDWDLSVQEDIEGLSVVSRVNENVVKGLYISRFKAHDFMLIALMKYKRIKALSVLRKKEEKRWITFLEGTQSRSGEFSVVLMLSGMEPVLNKLKGFVLDKTIAINERINSLSNQVNDLLIEVNKDNHKLIPGVLGRQRKYGHAWHMDKDCNKALRLFLETGSVMEEEEEEEDKTEKLSEGKKLKSKEDSRAMKD